MGNNVTIPNSVDFINSYGKNTHYEDVRMREMMSLILQYLLFTVVSRDFSADGITNTEAGAFSGLSSLTKLWVILIF